MLIRAVTLDDRQAWIDLAHESDVLIITLIPDITAFYEGFDEYMLRKIGKHEAFIAVNRLSSHCLGIIAYSKNHNRISFLGVTGKADFWLVGSKLMQVALDQLDNMQEISVNVLKSNAEILKHERELYELFGFSATGDAAIEAGIPAFVMKRPAIPSVSNEVRP